MSRCSGFDHPRSVLVSKKCRRLATNIQSVNLKRRSNFMMRCLGRPIKEGRDEDMGNTATHPVTKFNDA